MLKLIRVWGIYKMWGQLRAASIFHHSHTQCHSQGKSGDVPVSGISITLSLQNPPSFVVILPRSGEIFSPV